MCLELSGVHNPKKSWIQKHIDPQSYWEVINGLTDMLQCPAKVPKIWAFFMTSLKIKNVARIRDISEIFKISIIPARNIMIIQNGEEVTEGRFFAHEPYLVKRERAQYPQGPLSEQDAWTMPFATVANRPPLAAQLMRNLVCPKCLLDFSGDAPPVYDLGNQECLLDFPGDAPPDYDSVNQDVKGPLL